MAARHAAVRDTTVPQGRQRAEAEGDGDGDQKWRAGRQRVPGTLRGRAHEPHRRIPNRFASAGHTSLGIHVSLGARQAVRSVGAAPALDPIALNGLARQVPLLSSPGSIEQVLTRAPELGGGLAATFEPGQTILRIAAQLEGLPQRAGAHPSAYAVSFLGPGALVRFERKRSQRHPGQCCARPPDAYLPAHR